MKTQILYGFHPVAEALAAGKRKFFEVCLVMGKPSARRQRILALCQSLRVPVREMKAAQLTSLAGVGDHQGVAARVSEPPLFEIETVLENQAGQTGAGASFLLILDHVVDPGNTGALIRTALGVGVHGVVMAKDRSAPLSPAASKASAGAMEHMPLIRVTNLVSTLTLLKKQNVWVGGLDGSARDTIYDGDLKGPLALVIGGEEKGLRPLVKDTCDFLLSIPQSGPVTSLNASVAGAVAMYEAYRQRMHMQ